MQLALIAGGKHYDPDACKTRVKTRCRAVLDDNSDDLIDAVLQNATATGCADLLPQCTAGRAKLVLGPMYAKQGGRNPMFGSMMGAGVRDVWKKMPPKSRPYYLNQARSLSQFEPPEGWDPNGPKEQVLISEPKEEL